VVQVASHCHCPPFYLQWWTLSSRSLPCLMLCLLPLQPSSSSSTSSRGGVLHGPLHSALAALGTVVWRGLNWEALSPGGGGH
jgi:hypothetical protein